MDAVQNNPVAQDIRDTAQNGEDITTDSCGLYSQLAGPVGQSTKMSSELQDPTDTRRSPDEAAATSQPLTRRYKVNTATDREC